MTRHSRIAARLLAALCCAAALWTALDADQAQARRLREDADRQLNPLSVSPVLFALHGQGRLQPRAVYALGPGGEVLAASLPERAPVLEANKLDLSPVPVVGPAFGGEPLAARLRPRWRVGSVYAAGGDLAVRLDPRLEPERAAALLARPMALLTRMPRWRTPVALELPTLAVSQTRSAPLGPEIGGVYDAGDWLLLSPPREEFYGLDPLFD